MTVPSTDAVGEARSRLVGTANTQEGLNYDGPEIDDFEQAVRRAVLAECVCGHAKSAHYRTVLGDDACNVCEMTGENEVPPPLGPHAFESHVTALARITNALD